MRQAYRHTLLSLAVLPALLAGLQRAQPTVVGRVETRYDRFTDTTTVERDLVEWSKSEARFTVLANASFRGKEPNETAKFWLGLSCYRSGATRHTPPLLLEATTLRLLMDSGELEVQLKEYRDDFFELNRSLAESARAEISAADLRKVLATKTLAGRWGSAEFEFSDASLAALKDFISRMVLAPEMH